MPIARSFLCALLLTMLAPLAFADGEEPAQALLAKVVELRKAENVSALTEALVKVPEIYTATDSSGLQGKLRGEMGKVLKDKDLGDARRAALEAFTMLEDPKSAWKEVSKCLPDRKMEEPQEIDLAIVVSAGVFAQSRALKSLYELAGKAKNPRLSKSAVLALGGYGADEKNRVKILEELIDIAKKARPGRSTEKAISDEAQERWALLEPAVIHALNKLTGQGFSSFEDWEAMVKENKRDLKGLFIADDE